MRLNLGLWARLFCLEALRAISRHKLRSTLTALGIMIGIAAVILVVAIGRAGSARAEMELQKLGNNLVWVEAGSRNVAGARTGSHGTNSLTLEDAEAILHDVPLIRSLSPQVDGSLQVIFGNRNWSTRYRGVTPEYLDVKRWTLAGGRAFTDEEVQEAASVCLIGETVRQRLFGTANPVGQLIRMQGFPVEVVGLLAPKGQSSSGQDQDDTLFLPYTTAEKKLRGHGYTWLDDILCSAISTQAMGPAIDQVIALLRERHHIRPGEEDDFNIRRPEEVMKAQLESSRTLELLLLSVASISLLVGGIGIMNVMLASVAQRTREIGLRLAVGATEWEVQLQFLGEAVMLGLFGGVCGVALGVGGAYLFERFSDWQLAIPPDSIVLALGFSIGVGVFFGFYPARKAAALDPIDALRHE
jgi:putative ABC transport system permease protein